MIISANKIIGGGMDITENGQYTISIDVPKDAKMEQKAVDVTDFGEQVITPSEGYDGMSEVTLNVNTPKLDMTKTRLVYIDGDIDLRMLDMSNVTSLNEFARAMDDSFTSVDIRGWDTSKVTDMQLFFGGCGGLREIKGIEDIDVSNVTKMNNALSYTNIPTFDLTKWNTAKVTNLKEMFIGCANTKSINLSGWDVSKVTTVNGIFKKCRALTDVNLSGWDMSNITDISSIFEGCAALTNINMDGAILPKMEMMEFACAESPNVTRESMLSIFNALPQLNPGESYRFLLYPTISEKLTEEDKAILTNKGWQFF